MLRMPVPEKQLISLKFKTNIKFANMTFYR